MISSRTFGRLISSGYRITPPGSTKSYSCARVSGFIAITISSFSSLARYPFLLSRIEYQVGSPCMFDGNMFLPVTGIPILNNARNMVVFAVALPEPLIVLNVIQKSLKIFSVMESKQLLYLTQTFVHLPAYSGVKSG